MAKVVTEQHIGLLKEVQTWLAQSRDDVVLAKATSLELLLIGLKGENPTLNDRDIQLLRLLIKDARKAGLAVGKFEAWQAQFEAFRIFLVK